jgi:hypothetical protein
VWSGGTCFVWGIVWWVRDIMCREVWSGGTCFVWGIVWWVRDIMFREVWSGWMCFVWGIVWWVVVFWKYIDVDSFTLFWYLII